MKSGLSSSFKSTGHRFEYQSPKHQAVPSYSSIHGKKNEVLVPQMSSCYSARRHYESMQSKRTMVGDTNADKPPQTPRRKTPDITEPKRTYDPLGHFNKA